MGIGYSAFQNYILTKVQGSLPKLLMNFWATISAHRGEKTSQRCCAAYYHFNQTSRMKPSPNNNLSLHMPEVMHWNASNLISTPKKQTTPDIQVGSISKSSTYVSQTFCLTFWTTRRGCVKNWGLRIKKFRGGCLETKKHTKNPQITRFLDFFFGIL